MSCHSLSEAKPPNQLNRDAELPSVLIISLNTKPQEPEARCQFMAFLKLYFKISVLHKILIEQPVIHTQYMQYYSFMLQLNVLATQIMGITPGDITIHSTTTSDLDTSSLFMEKLALKQVSSKLAQSVELVMAQADMTSDIRLNSAA